MTSAPAPAPAEGPVDDASCETCGHPLRFHDTTGLRWCAATRLGIGTRKCICSGKVSEARVLSFY